MRDALNSTGRKIFYSLCEWYASQFKGKKIAVRAQPPTLLNLNMCYLLGARMIQLCGLEKLGTVGVQQMI
jgi:hypothetical protein